MPDERVCIRCHVDTGRSYVDKRRHGGAHVHEYIQASTTINPLQVKDIYLGEVGADFNVFCGGLWGRLGKLPGI